VFYSTLVNAVPWNKYVEDTQSGITASVKCLRSEDVRTVNDEDILHSLLIFLRITETWIWE